ncbi:MAG: hypothetical protein ABSG80_00285 [Verrucomicrobiota bacterium]
MQQRSGDEECRAKVPRSGRRRAGATAKFRASAWQASTFDFRLPIYGLAAGGPKLQMKSKAKDEVKKKEAGHYSGLSMRTKRLNQRFAVARPRTFVGCGAADYALLHTRNTAFLHTNDGIKIPEAVSPASHQFWLHANLGLYPSQTHFVTMQNNINDL